MASVVHKQPEISALFSKIIKNNQLQHAYIFEGVAGSGKFEMAKWLAQGINCQNRTEDGAPCLTCNQCVRIEHEEHPDVTMVEPDGLSIKVDQVRAIKEEFAKSGMESRRKILIIEDMDKMTTSAANSLLKFIEEPEGEITILLLTTEIQQLLPTIVSRCQIIHFPVRNVHDRIEEIVAREIPQASATLLANLTQDADEAQEIYEQENFSALVDTMWKWFSLLNKKNDQAFIYVQTNIMSFVDNRETSALMLDLLILLYRDLMTIYFDQDRVLAFSKYEKELNQLLSASMGQELSQIISIVLEGKKKLNRYVAAQGIFEQIALRIMNL